MFAFRRRQSQQLNRRILSPPVVDLRSPLTTRHSSLATRRAARRSQQSGDFTVIWCDWFRLLAWSGC
ncbi:hypothetical protein SOVF_025110 [Spinacia oleracea]|nr:hypothetical protein SOVF_025110 [Spinacia oleracea]